MGRTLHRNIDYTLNVKRESLKSDKIGEGMENLPKKAGVAHEGTWRYKRAGISHKMLHRILAKHRNEPYENVYGTIAKMFKTGSLERKLLEEDLKYMSINDGDKYRYEGYNIIDGVVRYMQKVNGKLTIVE